MILKVYFPLIAANVDNFFEKATPERLFNESFIKKNINGYSNDCI